MFILEHKELYRVPESVRGYLVFQSYRWKQYAIADDRETLQRIIDGKERPEDWRIEDLPESKSISEIEAALKKRKLKATAKKPNY